jgi:hypothetical protein
MRRKASRVPCRALHVQHKRKAGILERGETGEGRREERRGGEGREKDSQGADRG